MNRLILLAVLAAIGLACDGGVVVSARIVDSEGQPIADASIKVSDPTAARVFEAQADNSGCVSAGGTGAPGRYDFKVEITATGFKPLRVQAKSLQQHHYEIVLARESQSFRSQVTPVAQLPCPN